MVGIKETMPTLLLVQTFRRLYTDDGGEGMEHRCPKCGEICLASPSEERSVEAGAYRVTFRGIPFFSCPRGCVVDQPDVQGFLLSGLRLAGEFSHAIAKRKGLFGKRYVCRECGEDLVQEPKESTWDFRPDASGPMDLTITGPGLMCPRCQKAFLPQPIDVPNFGQAFSRPA